VVTRAFIKTTAWDGVAQHVYYHDGVGAEGDLFKRLLGGAIGLRLKQIIRECYDLKLLVYQGTKLTDDLATTLSSISTART
jgi:Uncharacterized alpha/beta hydrolase domain (DUF2235)